MSEHAVREFADRLAKLFEERAENVRTKLAWDGYCRRTEPNERSEDFTSMAEMVLLAAGASEEDLRARFEKALAERSERERPY